ncbi:hypothetical protein AK973_5814 [Pseudomonas brassicacearum]|nr:hypothetical protein AK973_5814 [Pseudomonas brassicacearum]
MIVPTLRVGNAAGDAPRPEADAERPLRHFHAERGNDLHPKTDWGTIGQYE